MRKAKKRYMGMDQHGHVYHNLVYPRRDLLEQLRGTHVDKMYVDLRSGGSRHCGYVIAGYWISLYEIRPINMTDELIEQEEILAALEKLPSIGE